MANPSTLGTVTTPTAVTGVTATASSSASGWLPSRLFDGLVGDSSANSWSASAVPTQWVQAALASSATVDSYRMVARTGAPNSSPKDFTLQGSNNGTTWTTLDTRTGVTWTAGQSQTFTVAAPASYSYYRLNMTATQGGGGTLPSFTEWTLYAGTTTGPSLSDWYSADAITGVADGGPVGFADIVDGSGNGHTFTSGSGPLLRYASGYNSRHWVDHAAGGGYTGPASTVPTGDLTFFGVIQATASGIQGLLGGGVGAPYVRLSSYKLELVKDNTASIATSTLTLTPGTWTPVLVTYTAATGSTRFRIGSSTETITGAANAAFATSATRTLGRRDNIAPEAFTGGWVELGRYRAVLSSGDEASLWAYLTSVSAPTTSGTGSVSVGSSSSSVTRTTATGSAPLGVGTSSASASPAATTTGTSPLAVASSAVTAPVVPAVTTGTAPVDLSSSAVTLTAGATVITGTSPIAVGTSSTSNSVIPASDAAVGPWTADPSGQGQIALDIPDGVIRLDPPLAVAPANIAERPIRVQVQSMPALTQGPDGQWRSDGAYPVAETVLGVPHLFVDGNDVTYLRGVPSRIYEWSLVEPGGEETAVIGFPQVMPFESTGEVGDELYWLNPDRDCEIAIVEADGTRHYVWSGIIVSEEQRLTATNAEQDWHARGVLYGAASAVKHQPPTWMPLTDIGTVIPDILNAVPSRRYAPLARVPTGIFTTDRGSSQDSVWDHVQRLLATAWTEAGQQWTIRRVGRAAYAMVLKDDTPVYTLQAGTRGVEHTLTRDKTQAPNIIKGRGIGPDGYGWARWHYPNVNFEDGIDAAYLDKAYRLPVAADPKVQPGHPEYDPKVLPTEIEIDFGTGITLDEAIRSAELQLGRDENAGMTGEITVRTDPAEGSRVLWQPGEVLEYRNLRGGDFSTGFQEWRLRPSRVRVGLMDDGIPVSLTVDSKARDQLSLVSILKRDQAATVDPARRPGAVNRRSRQEQDSIVEFDGEASGGIIPSHYVPARTWVCFWRPLSQVGRIVTVDYYSESRFALYLFAGDALPSHLDRWVGDPLASKEPWKAYPDEFDALGFIDGWGQLEDAAGYSPYAETANGGRTAGPFNGHLFDANSVEYVGYQNLWVKFCEWSADGGLMSGRVLPAVNV